MGSDDFIPDDGSALLTPVPMHGWWRPRDLRVEGDALRWEWSDAARADGTWERVRPPGELRRRRWAFEQFLALTNGDAADVLRYARTWGLMGLCGHFERFGACVQCSRRPFTAHLAGGRESVASWRRWASMARGLLIVAAAIRQGMPRSTNDWDYLESAVRGGAVGGTLSRVGFFRIPSLTDEERVATLVNRMWLDAGPPRLVVETAAHGWSVTFGGDDLDGLFRWLGVQLVGAISGVPAVAVCGNCASPYLPARLPKTGQRNWCKRPECQRAANAYAEHRRVHGQSKSRRQDGTQ
jgi:hypothetical protein